MSADRDARIRDHAYRLWEQEGRPHGRELDFWLTAEAQVSDAVAPAAPAKAKAPAKPKAAATPAAAKPAGRLKVKA